MCAEFRTLPVLIVITKVDWHRAWALHEVIIIVRVYECRCDLEAHLIKKHIVIGSIWIEDIEKYIEGEIIDPWRLIDPVSIIEEKIRILGMGRDRWLHSYVRDAGSLPPAVVCMRHKSWRCMTWESICQVEELEVIECLDAKCSARVGYWFPWIP